jgi:glycosyltransferase involved in cell wall biosynthesis
VDGRVLIALPAFNEAGRVGRVVRDVRSVLPEAEILVVDDGSADETAAEAGAAGAMVLSLPVNAGYGAALQVAYKYAVRNDFDMVGQIDADGQHRAEYLVAMLEMLRDDGIDVVVGSRFLDGDGHYKPTAARRAGIALFGRIASLVTRQRVTDPTSGFQVMRTSVARFFCSEVYPVDYPDVDILILLHRSGFTVREIPVQMRASTNASMHAGHRSLYYIYKMFLSILVTLMRPRVRDAK